MKLAILSVLIALGVSACAHEPSKPSEISRAWIELASGSSGRPFWILRVAASACPTLALDSGPIQLTLRAASSRHFPLNICETSLPALMRAGARARIFTNEEISVPAMPSTLNRIVVIGDTGCRIKKGPTGTVIQDCSDTKHGWPFAEVAKAAAALKPDLVVHVGDYLYREAECPEGDKRCEGSATGDTWRAWEQDFFEPAEPLLKAAPWIFVRGNHEDCKRAGDGYLRLFGFRPYAADCKTEKPYAIRVGDLQFAILDSSDHDVDSKKLSELRNLKLEAAWLFSHRPLWYVPPPGGKAPGKVGAPKGVSLVLAGHFHEFFVTDFADSRPAQLIAGNGGTKLDDDQRDFSGEAIDGTKISLFRSGSGFGFLTLERVGLQDWKAVARRQSGESYLECGLKRTARGTLSLDCP